MGGYLAAISVSGAERDRVLDLVRGASEPNWLAAGIPGMSQGLNGVLECERTAISIVYWSPLAIPGLLQTSDYAKAILGAGSSNPSSVEVEARVLLRAGRRDMFSRSNPTRLHALIGEPALQAPIGGREVLLEQLRYLLKMAEEVEPVTVQVIRTEIPWHPGLAGPFVFYEFEDSPPIVHLEQHRSSAFLYEESDVAEYARVATALREETAMSPRNSLGLIAEIITELERMR